MSDSETEPRLGRKLGSSLRYMTVCLCATVLISSSLFSLFLRVFARPIQVLEIGDYVTLILIPFATSLAMGAALGGVRQGLLSLVPTVLLSLIVSIGLSTIPVTGNMIEDVALSNLYLLTVLRINVTVLLPMLFVLIPGVVVGGLIVAGTLDYPLDS